MLGIKSTKLQVKNDNILMNGKPMLRLFTVDNSMRVAPYWTSLKETDLTYLSCLIVNTEGIIQSSLECEDQVVSNGDLIVLILKLSSEALRHDKILTNVFRVESNSFSDRSSYLAENIYS
jgi:hypothetical protein